MSEHKPERRPRVVMLVGNFIEGDSRVQKEARSAAAAGWDTYLLGRSDSGLREVRAIGDATIIHVAETMAATRYRSAHPRRRLNGLIAYSSQDLSRVKHQRQRLRIMDLAVERELLKKKLAEANPLSAAATKAAFTAHALDVKARGYWVAARKQAFDRNYKAKDDNPSTGAEARRARRGNDGAAWDAQPRLVDFEQSFGPVVDELAPDLVHANDAEMLGVAVRAAARAKAAGRTMRVVYDAHEFFAGDVRENPTWGPVMAAQERKYISLADAVMSPIEGYADAMVEYHGLERFPGGRPPVLVKNMPSMEDLAASGGLGSGGVRADLKLDAGVPLLVHPGSVTKVRGLEAVVRALPQLDGVHAALIVGKRDGYITELTALAAQLGVADRFHLLDYVPSSELTAYLSSANVGIDTLLHIPLHELTITTKYWSYISARLPMVVSDVKATAALTRELGCGEVYVAGDADGFAAAVRKVLADPGKYTASYGEETLARFSWEGQAEVMLNLYSEVTGLRP